MFTDGEDDDILQQDVHQEYNRPPSGLSRWGSCVL